MSDSDPHGREWWTAQYDGERTDRAPSGWIVEQCRELPPGTLIVDIAGGSGRHATPLTHAGLRVVVVDFVERAVAAAVRRVAGAGGVVADTGALPFRACSLPAILTVNYLDRPLFPVLVGLLRPGGYLIVETYTREHLQLVAEGRARSPRNPAYTLAPGELPGLVAPLRVVASHEGLVRDAAGERYAAGVVAVKD